MTYHSQTGKERIPLDAEEKQRLRDEVFTRYPDDPCEDCGGLHWGVCPRIKRLVLVGTGQGIGNRVEVEYWHDWDDSGVTYAEEAWEDDE